MTRPNPWLRAGLTIAVLLVLGLVFALARMVRANGPFASVTPGFAGSCKTLPLAGVSDMELDAADHLLFLAVLDARHPGAADGLYALDLAGTGKPVRLAGAPPDFHPRGISLLRTPNGGLFLAAINHGGASAQAGATKNASGAFSIDTFEVTRQNGTPALKAQGMVMGGLLADPQDVALVGPDAFYVSNGVTAKNPLMRMLQTWGVMAGGDILLFNGTLLREVVDGLAGPRGLALTPDGGHVLVAGATGRNVISLAREDFTGNLSEAGRLELDAGADRLTIDGQGRLWVGGHANLLAWARFGRDPASRAPSQIFRVTLAGGVPQSAEQVYGDDGGQIAAAAVAAASGKRLFIGSPLDNKLLDCLLR